MLPSGPTATRQSTLWQPRSETPYCGNFLLYAPRVSRCLLPNHGKFYFLTADRNRPDRLNVRARAAIRTEGSTVLKKSGPD